MGVSVLPYLEIHFDTLVKDMNTTREISKEIKTSLSKMRKFGREVRDRLKIERVIQDVYDQYICACIISERELKEGVDMMLKQAMWELAEHLKNPNPRKIFVSGSLAFILNLHDLHGESILLDPHGAIRNCVCSEKSNTAYNGDLVLDRMLKNYNIRNYNELVGNRQILLLHSHFIPCSNVEKKNEFAQVIGEFATANPNIQVYISYDKPYWFTKAHQSYKYMEKENVQVFYLKEENGSQSETEKRDICSQRIRDRRTKEDKIIEMMGLYDDNVQCGGKVKRHNQCKNDGCYERPIKSKPVGKKTRQTKYFKSCYRAEVYGEEITASIYWIAETSVDCNRSTMKIFTCL